jgi:hypothetical protein
MTLEMACLGDTPSRNLARGLAKVRWETSHIKLAAISRGPDHAQLGASPEKMVVVAVHTMQAP